MEIESEVVVKTVNKPSRSSGGKRSGGRSWRASRTETEEEAANRRFHDAQRMARFRARRKKALEEQLQAQGAAEARRCSSSVSGQDESDPERHQAAPDPPTPRPHQSSLREMSSAETESKYGQLLAIIERLGRDVRLSYAGSRSSAERLKSGIGRARTLVRDCLIETRLNLRQ